MKTYVATGMLECIGLWFWSDWHQNNHVDMTRTRKIRAGRLFSWQTNQKDLSQILKIIHS